jgi:hypothetical protein
MAVRTVEGRWLLLGALVEKIAFFHEKRSSFVVGRSSLAVKLMALDRESDYYMFDSERAMARCGSGGNERWRRRKR